MQNKKMIKMPRVLFALLFILMLGSWSISADTPVSQAAQKQEETEQELPAGGVDEIRIFRMDAGAAEHVPSYENQLSFFSRTTSVLEAGKGDYGYNSLADNQKSLYMSLEISLRNFLSLEDAEFTKVGASYVPFRVSCNLTEVSMEEISQVVTAFEADHPGLFWVRNFVTSSSSGTSGRYQCDIMPSVVDEYRNDPAGVKEMYAKIEDGVAGYLDAVAGVDDTYEKVRIVYDKLINEVEYANDSSGKPENADWAHSIIGVFDGVHKSVVCEGYAKTFSFLMNILDIPNVYIVGIVESTSDNPNHAWNAVSFDGGDTYYYVDATWDDKGEYNDPQNQYKYFAMPKSVFEESHIADTPLVDDGECELPTLGDDMKFTYFVRYAALATKDMVSDPESAKEFLMAASALAPGKFCLVLVPDDFRTRRNMQEALGGVSIGSSGWSYGTMDVELYVMPAENYSPAIPAKSFSLSDQETTIDMDETTTGEIKVCSVTEGSDDYIRCYSSDEKVATVEKAYVKAREGESIHIVAKGEGTAVIYAKSAKGGAVAACTVSVKPASVPIPTATPAPVNPPSKYGLASPRMDSDRVTTWDCVYFGNYWQNDTNGDGVADEKDEKEPVKWRVLSADGDDVFLMADQTLDVQPYHNVRGKVTWETSALREWLNDTFLNIAFSGDEQLAIQTTRVVNNDGYRTDDEKDTDDKLYLLSLGEVTDTSYGFITSSISTAAREQLNTQYAERKCQNAESFGKVDHWWLRSMGEQSDYKYIDYTSIVYEEGMVYWRGCASDINGGVRPVLHLNLSSTSAWSLAGTVSSDGTVTSPNTKPTPTIVPTYNPAASPAVSPVPTVAATGMPSLNLANPRINEDGVTTWDCVYFGNYWQSDTDGNGKADQNDSKEPIKWRVLEVDGEDVFLLADQNLDVKRYSGYPWEDSSVRSWLNDTFLCDAFTSNEQSAIKNTAVINKKNEKYSISGGNDTEDKVFLLSISEATNASYGFTPKMGNTNTRKSENTEYVADGGSIGSQYMKNAGDCDWWWLRSPGFCRAAASDVDENGCVDQKGVQTGIRNRAVRPALHLNLSSADVCSPAGTVSSDGTAIEIAPVPTIKPTETSTPVPTASPAAIPPSAIPSVMPSSPPFSGSLSNPRTDCDGVTTWDAVYFGNYWQEDTNGDGKADKNDEKIPIKWRVLSVDSDDAFLLADQNIDCQKYNDDYTSVTWETCTMRSWLNGYGADANKGGKDYSGDNFLANAFTRSEQSAIMTTTVVNKDNVYGTEGGIDTQDKVYLLSIHEAKNPAYGFSSDYREFDQAKQAKNTAYAKEMGAWESTSEEYAGTGCWWLRSPGYSGYYASGVFNYGYVDYSGFDVNYSDKATRPVLHLNLKASLDTGSVWSYAGTVTSEGEVKGPVSMPTATPSASAVPTDKPDIMSTENPETVPTPSPLPMQKQTALPVPTATAVPTKAPLSTASPSAVPSNPPFQKSLSNPRTDSDGVTTWDAVYFGNYWQEDTNGDGKADKNDEKIPIKWRVLSVDGNDAYLLAEKNLDVKEYYNILPTTSVTWENCTIRSWLNGYGAEMNKSGKDYSGDNFLNNAFSKDEQSAIQMTNVVNNEDPRNDAEKGNDTLDKVYLLSNDEVVNPSYGFSTDYSKEDKGRRAKNSVYAKGEGAYTGIGEYTGNGWWQLRTPSGWGNGPVCVTETGLVRTGGDLVVEGYRRCADAVRPVLHLNLSAKGWSYAGTVSSDETAGGTVTPSPVPMTTTTPTATPVFTPVAVPSNPPFQKSLANPEISDGITTWDCIYFGNYWQEDTNEDGKADTNDAKQPIKWRVLSVDGDDVFLLAEKNLDAQEYNDANTSITWETCTMRSWLNGYGSAMNREGKDYSGSGFINNAFSGQEQSAIQNTNIVNDAYGKWPWGGNDTSDKVYLLSIDEVTNSEYGFATDDRQCDEGRRAKNTAYAKLQGVNNNTSEEHSENGRWWLRTLGGAYNRNARCVNYAGDVNFCYYGYYNSNYHQAVRPALRLNLLSVSSWSYAGTVSSDGTETEAATPSPTPLPATATPKPTNTPDISPTEHPGTTPTTQPLPTVKPTQKPTDSPIPPPKVTSSPTESPTLSPEDTSSPTDTPQPTSSPEPVKQPSQPTLVPLATATPNPNEIGVPDNRIEKRLKKGDSFVTGNIKYRVTKIKGKKGEAAVAGVKSKKSKSFVIPQIVKKEGIMFTVTSIRKNAFKGCRRAKTLTIKSTSIRGITKKALAGLVKRIQIKIPKSKTAQYWGAMRKLGYSKITW